jgi:hypothetical protein
MLVSAGRDNTAARRLFGTKLEGANFDIDLGDPFELVQVILMEWAPLQVRRYSSDILCFDNRCVANLMTLLISQDASERDRRELLCQVLAELVAQLEHPLFRPRLQETGKQEEHDLSFHRGPSLCRKRESYPWGAD